MVDSDIVVLPLYIQLSLASAKPSGADVVVAMSVVPPVDDRTQKVLVVRKENKLRDS